MGYPSLKKSFSSNALASKYALNNIDDFEKIGKKRKYVFKILFSIVKNIDVDDVLYDLYQTEGPLAGNISFKSFRRLRSEGQGQ